MSPSEERELGRIGGKVDLLVDQLVEFQRNVGKRLDRFEASVHADLGRKANARETEAHERRIDALEADRDRRAGAVQFVRFAQGLILAAATVGLYLAGGGHV